MTEKKTETKAPKKAPAAKAESKPAAEKKAAPKAGATLTIKQVGSPIGRQDYQRATLVGLGLNKLHRTRTLADTPEVRGMLKKVEHLVEVVK